MKHIQKYAECPENETDATLEGVKEDFETRRKLRPLLDQIDKAAREL